jgi:Protein of Unknown function (DUF2784)
MHYRLLADAVVFVHLAFIAFALAGGLLALRWPRVVWLHLPAALWAALVEFAGWYCPLTTFEVRLRMAGGGEGYAGDFVERYILPVLYPAELTRGLQMVLGAIVVGVNVAVYLWLWRRRGTTAYTTGRDDGGS